MGNCVAKLKGKSGGRPVTLLALGLDNAGKTTTVHGVKGESVSEIAPTIGFEEFDIHTRDYDVKIYDLGGGARIRGIWEQYFAEAHGIVYVVDSADLERMEECRVIFDNLVSDPRIRGKPILILANKQDKPEAVTELELCTRMKLDEVVNRNECHSKVILCSALPSYGKKVPRKKSKLDRGIKNGYIWLLDMISQAYDSLQQRIDSDVGEQKKQEAKEREERMERVRKRREERERQEQISEENEVTDNRPRPDGISCQELPNERLVASQAASISSAISAEESDPSTEHNRSTISQVRPENSTITSQDSKQANVGDSQAFTPKDIFTAKSSLPGTAITNPAFDDSLDVQIKNVTEEISEHPRALSAASLKELVRDTPTPTQLESTASTLTGVLETLHSNHALPDSVVSLRNQGDESGSVTSSNTERKKKKKKRKHKSQNKVNPGNSNESLQGKLAPIPNIPNSNAGFGKLPPIGISPNYNSDVEL